MRRSLRQATLVILLIAAGCGDDSRVCDNDSSVPSHDTSGGQPSGSGGAPAGSYQVTVSMAGPTVTALLESGYHLYVFKAISASDTAGRPLVWFWTQHYSQNTVLEWEEQYSAYTSFTPIAPPAPISVGASYAIAPGQVLDFQMEGVGVVTNQGQPGVLEIDNQTTSPSTCGIAQPHHVAGDVNASTPICALPLYGKHSQSFTPVAKVLLFFATAPVTPGTPVETALGASVLIDLTDAKARSVSYDINDGWSWGNSIWASPVADQAPLAPLLIVPPSAI